MNTWPKQSVKPENHDALKKIEETLHASFFLKRSLSENSTNSDIASWGHLSDESTLAPGMAKPYKDWRQQYESILAYVAMPVAPHFASAISIYPDFHSFEKVIEYLALCGFAESANYIAYLRSTDDLEEGDKPLTLESAMGFVTLMQNFSDLGEPMIGLFSEGTISAEWRIADDKHLLIEPLDGNKASFAFIGPSDDPGEKFRLNGRGTITEIIGTLRKHDVHQWKGV